ncbi:MAG: response regulator [Lachnospiraceae bacterium]|nr:response regulator [Lachnospiraceae bacterium]
MSKRLPNVLMVDDTLQDLEIMSMYLEDVAKVHTVSSGAQAIEYVQQTKIDVILLDVAMPIMDGFQTLERLRKLEECINVPVVLVTNLCDRDTVLNSVIMGIDGYLVKPVTKETLQKKVLEVYNEQCQEQEERKTVLLVDDDMSYLKQLNSFLQEKYNVIMINSAKLASEYLLKHVPDVVVLDYQMPLFNGVSMMRLIQKNPSGKNIPVIILSGALSREILQECYAYNPAACLAKPVSKEVLEENIELALKQQ